jgi:hypothetical protein
MNIRLGIYEIFSRIVPGGVYITAIVQLLNVLGLLTIDWQALNDMSLIASTGLAVVAYIVGGALNPYSFIWLQLFGLKGVSHETLAAFKARHRDHWDIDIHDKDWPVLLAFLRTKDLEVSGDIERQNAISIMLRNVSLGLGLMAANFVIAFALYRTLENMLAAVVTLVVSVLIARESTKFRRWFYDNVFETTLAYRLDLERMIKPKYGGSIKPKREENQEE